MITAIDVDWEWIRLHVLPPMWRTEDAIEELRSCVCQAPPSNWLGGTVEPEARLWDRDGRTVADGRSLVVLWAADHTCMRRSV